MKLKKLIIGILALWLVGNSGFAQTYKVVTVPSPGELKTALGNDWNQIDSVVLQGTINKEDFKTLYDCSRLGKLTVINLEHGSVEGNRIPDYALYYPNISFDGYLPIKHIILPDNITEIGKYAFTNLLLKKINFPSVLKKFSDGSFIGCHWLEVDPLVIPEGITEIPRECFAHCQSFRKLVLPQSLKVLGGFSFYNTRMDEMNLPEGLETIETSAFWGSALLRNVVIPESAINLGIGAFAQNDSLRSLKLPQGITEIPDLFLAYSNEIDTIIIPDNVVKIGNNAFQWDYDLSYIRIPNRLERIGFYAFIGTNIAEIILPETLEFIGLCAFFDLKYLEKVYCMAKNPPTAELDPLNFYYGPFHYSYPGRYCTLYVPIGSGDLYRTAEGWEDFDQIIETGEFPSDCGIVFATACKATACEGGIQISNPTGLPVDVKVYDTNGRMTLQEKVTERSVMAVSPGIYLVQMGNKTEKVLVR